MNQTKKKCNKNREREKQAKKRKTRIEKKI